MILILLGSLAMGCSEDSEVVPEENVEETEGDAGNDQSYFPPVSSDDWETSSAVELGWDTTSLNDAIRYAREKRSHNLLIIHKGKLVVEEYWNETTASTQHELNSVAKSMMGFVVGQLQQDGTISVDDKVSDYLQEGWSQSPNTEAEITLRHLMTMTSGLNEDLQYVARPGESWRYSHAAYKVLFDVIKTAVGSSSRDLFGSVLFSRIGMKNVSWAGYDLSSSAREIAKFGLLVLNRGNWDGEKLLSDDGYFSDMISTSQPLQEAYGYLWWLNGTNTWYDDDNKIMNEGSIAHSMPDDAWLAKGYHDQRIYIVPSLDMVVIRQGAYTGLPESGEGSFDVELWKRIMNAVNSEGSAQ